MWHSLTDTMDDVGAQFVDAQQSSPEDELPAVEDAAAGHASHASPSGNWSDMNWFWSITGILALGTGLTLASFRSVRSRGRASGDCECHYYGAIEPCLQILANNS